MINIHVTRHIDKYIGVPLCVFFYALGRFTDLLRRSREPEETKRILLIKFWGIGNIIMLFPTLREVRRSFAGAEITFCTLLHNREILEESPYVDEVLFLDNGGYLRFSWSLLRMLTRLRRKKIDLVLDFEQFAKISTLLAWAVGARRRIGFRTRGQGRGFLYTTPVDYRNDRHMVRSFFSIARAAGVGEADLDLPGIPIPEKSRETIKSFERAHHIGADCLLVGIHPGTSVNFTFRRWPAENFARLADHLIETHGATVVFTGAADEKVLVREVVGRMSREAIDLCGRLGIKELAALMERCSLFFSSDTAPVHMGAAMKTTVVGLYGPNTPDLYGPWGPGHLVFYKAMTCSPCITNFNAKVSHCTSPRCMEAITVEEVMEKLEERLLRRSPRQSQ